MADESVRKLPKTESTPSAEGKRATEGASSPKDAGSKKPLEVAKIHTMSDGGKGSGQRPTDPKKWSDWWNKYCEEHGHSYVNRICKYCGGFNEETPDWMKED